MQGRPVSISHIGGPVACSCRSATVIALSPIDDRSIVYLHFVTDRRHQSIVTYIRAKAYGYGQKEPMHADMHRIRIVTVAVVAPACRWGKSRPVAFDHPRPRSQGSARSDQLHENA